jgi:hypothetical protein
MKQADRGNTELLYANQAGETLMKSAVLFCVFTPVLVIMPAQAQGGNWKYRAYW